jgi:hypothetical protein
MPVHVNNDHYVLFIVHMETRSVEVVDSMASTKHLDRYADPICSVLKLMTSGRKQQMFDGRSVMLHSSLIAATVASMS